MFAVVLLAIIGVIQEDARTGIRIRVDGLRVHHDGPLHHTSVRVGDLKQVYNGTHQDKEVLFSLTKTECEKRAASRMSNFQFQLLSHLVLDRHSRIGTNHAQKSDAGK